MEEVLNLKDIFEGVFACNNNQLFTFVFENREECDVFCLKHYHHDTLCELIQAWNN